MPTRINLNHRNGKSGSEEFRSANESSLRTAAGLQSIIAGQQEMGRAAAEEERRKAEFDMHVRDAERKYMTDEINTRLKIQAHELDRRLAESREGRAEAQEGRAVESHGSQQRDSRFQFRQRVQDVFDRAAAKSAAHRADAHKFVSSLMDLPQEMVERGMQAIDIGAGIEDPAERDAYFAGKSLEIHRAHDESKREGVAERIGDLRSRLAYGDMDQGAEDPAVTQQIDGLLQGLADGSITWQKASQAEASIRGAVATSVHRRRRKMARATAAEQLFVSMQQFGDPDINEAALMTKGLIEAEQDTDVDGDGVIDEPRPVVEIFKDVLKGRQSVGVAKMRAQATQAGQRSPRQRAVETLTRARGRSPTRKEVDDYLAAEAEEAPSESGESTDGTAPGPATPGPATDDPRGGGSIYGDMQEINAAGASGETRAPNGMMKFSPETIGRILGKARRTGGS